jgi:integrase
MGKLTDRKIQALTKRESDGQGLYCKPLDGGRKAWLYRWKVGGKDQQIWFGEYYKQSTKAESAKAAAERKRGGRYTLSEARIEHQRLRDIVKQGKDPRVQREQAKVAAMAAQENTFAFVAQEYVSERLKNKSHSYLYQTTNLLKNRINKHIGDRPIDSLEPSDILAVLKKSADKPATAERVRTILSGVFKYAVTHLLCPRNPVNDVYSAVPVRKVQHKKPLNAKELVKFFEALRNYGGTPQVKTLIHLGMLTVTRPSELRCAEWSEFDLDDALWIVPAGRIGRKGKPEHKVPLSKRAIELLKELACITGSGKYLFPNSRRPSEPMTTTTVNRALENMGVNGEGTMGYSAHAARATFSTWAYEAEYDPVVIEKQLDHEIQTKVQTSYNQHQYMSKRIALMNDYSKYLTGCEQGKTNVVSINMKNGSKK